MVMDKKRSLLVLGVLIAVIALAFVLSIQGDDDSEHIRIVTSLYPLGYMAQEIGGDKVEVDLLVPENTEVHSWYPSASDVLKVSRADLFVYNGAGLEPWVEYSLLPSLEDSKMAVVETTKGLDLVTSYDHDLTRLFIFDNDNSRTLVYDISEDNAVLVTTLPFGMNTTRHSGFFDNAPQLRNSFGDSYLFIPNPEDLKVLNTGLHGDHFHDPELVTSIDAGMPRHYAISHDNKQIAFALDNEQKVLVVNVDNPGAYSKYEDKGTSSTSHATIEYDEDGLLYIGEMRTPAGENLRIIQASNGDLVAQGNAGESPHGGVYSTFTGKVYFNGRGDTFGLVRMSSSGYEGLIPYTHTGTYLARSWISEDGKWLISYVGDQSMGLEYSSVLVYDLVNEVLEKEIEVQVQRVAEEHGWPNSVFISGSNMVALSDPNEGRVVLVDLETGNTHNVQLEGSFPQAMRIIENEDKDTLRALTADGNVHLIGLDKMSVIRTWQLEEQPGSNNVLALVAAESGSHNDHDGHQHGLYDPHTWISPYIAMQQGERIYEAIVQADPENEAYYTQRWNSLKNELTGLDERYVNELANTEKEYIFVTHAAYGYLAGRYGFQQEGVIGISADEQPSSSAMAALVNKMIDTDTYFLYVDPVYSDAYVKTLKSNTEKLSGQEVQVETLYLMTGSIDNKDYLEQMEANLEALKKGLRAM
ncbi:metal ABC transporter solute-binding protein, Zn/Mn family [Methanolobus sp. WCC5]|uniref:metal ABC transporter solute-binding protein, Zn/Mn family n=1 Tax=Methanolobus sp. WCC5 TaxID=3125785 RepID=UPI003246CB4A